jgi:hypothetical protein
VPGLPFSDPFRGQILPETGAALYKQKAKNSLLLFAFALERMHFLPEKAGVFTFLFFFFHLLFFLHFLPGIATIGQAGKSDSSDTAGRNKGDKRFFHDDSFKYVKVTTISVPASAL